MKKLYLIKNQEVFQGEKYLNTNKNFFEGWYFKNTSNENSIAFIPGISLNKDSKKAFIQIITNDSSYFVDYDIKDFTYHVDPFYIKIKDNYFSPRKIHLNIKDEQQNLTIHGKLKYSNNKNIKTNILNPNIMGPFSYIPFMECNHAIISMKNNINGIIDINNQKIKFNDGIGYIEKDWGYSFPKSYLWCQANNFKNQNVSFMFSVATIPFKLFKFKGFICVLIINDKEYKFTTYNNSKIIKYNVNDQVIDITLKNKNHYLNIKSLIKDSYKLSAPSNGKMNKDIFETINATTRITLRKDNEVIFSDESSNCGLEIV